MAKKKSSLVKPGSQLKKLNFLIGKWHTKGEIVNGNFNAGKEISGMDTYEWISGGFFILHRVDVLIGKKRTEVIEIIGYDESRKSYFMRSFDNQGESITMYADLVNPGLLKLGDNKMRSTLSVNRKGDTMIAKWELSEDGKIWKRWMDIELHK